MPMMIQSMRWFGPTDPVTLQDLRQAGCSGVVTALHHIPVGEIWPVEEINKRKQVVEEAGMIWSAVESLPVHEDIKKHTGNYQQYIENYKTSLRNLAACGLKIITYNFMPVMDWLRTDISYTLPDGSKALYFERAAFIAFDLFILKRPNAEKDYLPAEFVKATARFNSMSEAEKETLLRNVMLSLPGSNDSFTPGQVLSAIKTYEHIDRQTLKQHLFYFLQQVVPVAEECGLKMAIHPDDPPFPALGLPRIVSNEDDLDELLKAAPSPANGICFCTGSFGAAPANDLVHMIRRFGDKVQFFHLRNTRKDTEGNFFEAGLLDGDADMYTLVEEVQKIMRRRNTAIPVRPDHGHQLLDDLDKKTYPGYSAIGRLKNLAEIRGLELAIARNLDNLNKQ